MPRNASDFFNFRVGLCLHYGGAGIGKVNKSELRGMRFSSLSPFLSLSKSRGLIIASSSLAFGFHFLNRLECLSILRPSPKSLGLV